MLRPTLRRSLAAVLLAGAAANASATITFTAGYDGPWEWDEVTMTTWTEGSGMNTRTYYKGTACITGYNGSETELTIPRKIGWYHDVTGPDLSIHYEYEVEVVAIGEKAFAGYSSYYSSHYAHNETLTSITIPDSVTSIEGYAFFYCSGLMSITIPDSVTSIGNNAFSYCSGLTSITIPDSVTNIENSAFSCCSGLTSITVLGNVKNNYNWEDNCGPFYNCSNVETLTLGSKMTKIGNYMFDGLPNIKSITIPDNVTSIGNKAFNNCSGLTSITILGNVTNDWNSSWHPFYNCSNVETLTLGSKMTTIGDYMFCYLSKIKSIMIPNNVTSIGNNAFYSCSGATTISIGNSVTSIGNAAFSSCSGATTISIGNSVSSIGGGAFGSCYRLGSIAFPDSMRTIGADAFNGCTALGAVAFGGTESVGDNAFKGCTGLKEVTFPDSMRSLGAGAFSGCTALSTVAFPAGIESVDAGAFSGASVKTLLFDNANGAFLDDISKESLRTLFLGPNARGATGERLADCTALQSVLVAKGNPAYATDKKGALYDASFATLVKYPCASSAESFTVPATVRTVEPWAFAHATALRQIAFPGGVETIGRGAFDWCLSLESLLFPATLASVGDGALRVCPALETVRFEGDVADLGASQFLYAKPTIQAHRAYAGWEGAAAAAGCALAWIEDLGEEATSTTPVPVPYAWLDREAATILAANGGDYEAAALATAANGENAVWECYVAGIDPEDATAAFLAKIEIVDGAARISYDPDLGDARIYLVEGKETLDDETWSSTNGATRFFRVKVSMPE